MSAEQKCYDPVWEIFNKCANNQMRDIFIEEIETDDTDAYVRAKIQDRCLEWDKTVLKDGTIVYDINATGTKERFSFTEI